MAEINRPKSYTGMEPFIFVSYAHADVKAADEIILAMQRAGCRLWFDEGIRKGADWREEIAAAIENCACFLVLLSPAYLNSYHCRNEIYYAETRRRKMLTIYLEELQLRGAMEMSLGRFQAVLKYQYAEEKAFLDCVMEAEGLRGMQGGQTALGGSDSVATGCEELGTAAVTGDAMLAERLRALSHANIMPFGASPDAADYPLSRWCRLKIREEDDRQTMTMPQNTDDALVVRLASWLLHREWARRNARIRRWEVVKALENRVHAIRQAASALEYLHEQGLGLGCLTPEVAMLTARPAPADAPLPTLAGAALQPLCPRLYISDLSAIHSLGQSVESLPPVSAGDEDYVSPEIRRGEALAEMADVYSLGMLLRCTILLPPALTELLSAKAREAMEAVAQRAAQEDAAERYASVAEFARALDAVLEAHPLPVMKKPEGVYFDA